MCLVIMDRDWAAGRYCAGGLRGRRFVRRAMGRGLAEERRRARAEGSVADGVCQCSFLHTSCTRADHSARWTSPAGLTADVSLRAARQGAVDRGLMRWACAAMITEQDAGHPIRALCVDEAPPLWVG